MHRKTIACLMFAVLAAAMSQGAARAQELVSTQVPQRLRSTLNGAGLAVGVGIDALMNLTRELRQKHGVARSLEATADYVFSADYVVGALGGGVAGAALGAMLPVPLLGGFAGSVLMGMPTLMGAMLGSSVFGQVIAGRAGKSTDISTIIKGIDWIGLTCQAAGSLAGSALASGLAPGLLPQVAGGLVGCFVGEWVGRLVKKALGISVQNGHYTAVQVQARSTFHPSEIRATRSPEQDDLYRRFLDAARAGAIEDAARHYRAYVRKSQTHE